MIYDAEFESISRGELEILQLKRLREVAKRLYENVPFSKKKFDDAGIKPDDIKELGDLKNLPFTYKDDLRDNYPFGLFAVPMDDIVRIHASSGTTGKPTVVGYTKNDINTWSVLIARTLASAGVTKSDIIQNAYGYGLFTGGLGFHYGVEKLGASVIPISGGNTKRQIMIMQDFATTVLTCTPSYALYISEVAEELGADFKKMKLKVGVLGAEPWSNKMRDEIENKLNIDAIDLYGLSEIIGPGVSSECIEAKDGLHIFEDHFIPEIIDPDTEEVLPYGEKGELVFTTITKQALPLIRYRTKDISVLNPEPCKCGRTHIRMERVSGRTDDMLIIRGVNVFPSQIESVLLNTEKVEPHYQMIVEREGALDILKVNVEVNETVFSDEIKGLQKLEKNIEFEIKDLLGVNVTIKLVEPKTIQRSEGKAVRVIDNRNI